LLQDAFFDGKHPLEAFPSLKWGSKWQSLSLWVILSITSLRRIYGKHLAFPVRG
jgi:hypothetical protein